MSAWEQLLGLAAAAVSGGGIGAVTTMLAQRWRAKADEHTADATIERSRVIAKERVRIAEVQADTAREEREADAEARTVDRLWDRVESLEHRHADCEKRNTECEQRATRNEAKATRLEAENSSLATQVHRMSLQLGWDPEDTQVGKIGRIARRTPTPPDRAAVAEEVHVRVDDERREDR